MELTGLAVHVRYGRQGENARVEMKTLMQWNKKKNYKIYLVLLLSL
jgi:predicted DNA-binding WGR domain protein